MADDEYVALTLDGARQALDMHSKLLDGWTLEQVATYYDLDTMLVRVLLSIFYSTVENSGIEIDSPSDIEEL